MAGAVLGAAALGAAVGAGTTIYNDKKGFAARHDQTYDFQMALIQALTEKSLKAFQDGNITKEEYQELRILSQKSIAGANEYLTSLSKYKETSVFNPIRKSENVDRVRKSKRRLRDQTMEFASHYSGSISSAGSQPSTASGSAGYNSEGFKSGDDDFSDAEELASGASPIEVGLSLSKLFPHFSSLRQEEYERLASRFSLISVKSRFYRVLKTEKALYDRQLYHIANGFISFYTENFPDEDDTQRELMQSVISVVKRIFECYSR